MTKEQKATLAEWKRSPAGREFKRWEARQRWAQSTLRYGGIRPREKSA